jgi:hypothetical protein
MAISQVQAMNFVTRTRGNYLFMLSQIREAQCTALANSQEVTAWGGGATITGAIDDTTWSTTYPFTKAEFHDILSNFSSAADLLGSHGDLKTNLTKLRE